MNDQQNKKDKSKKIIAWIILGLLALVFGAATYFFFFVREQKERDEKMDEKINTISQNVRGALQDTLVENFEKRLAALDSGVTRLKSVIDSCCGERKKVVVLAPKQNKKLEPAVKTSTASDSTKKQRVAVTMPADTSQYAATVQTIVSPTTITMATLRQQEVADTTTKKEERAKRRRPFPLIFYN